MVINSKFQDYYDFVATKFGGGDPRVVYSRGRMKISYIEATVRLNDPRRYYEGSRTDPEKDYMYLVIAGKAYLLARPANLLTFDVNTFRVIDPEIDKKPRWVQFRDSFEFGKEYESLVELCKDLQAPVFIISGIDYMSNNKTYVLICEQCPILGRIGMASRISPYQMYQDIAVFVGNRMTRTPDIQPPIELSNTQKILKAGFDLRQSFRHR